FARVLSWDQRASAAGADGARNHVGRMPLDLPRRKRSTAQNRRNHTFDQQNCWTIVKSIFPSESLVGSTTGKVSIKVWTFASKTAPPSPLRTLAPPGMTSSGRLARESLSTGQPRVRNGHPQDRPPPPTPRWSRPTMHLAPVVADAKMV